METIIPESNKSRLKRYIKRIPTTFSSSGIPVDYEAMSNVLYHISSGSNSIGEFNQHTVYIRLYVDLFPDDISSRNLDLYIYSDSKFTKEEAIESLIKNIHKVLKSSFNKKTINKILDYLEYRYNRIKG